MIILLLTLVFPFVLFIGGSYVLGYPVGVGILYSVNVALIYLVMLAINNQIIKIHTQQLEIRGSLLVLSCKQMGRSFPLMRRSDLEVPIGDIKNLLMIQTRAGYELTVQFEIDGKLMGVDLDINPLIPKNGMTIERVLGLNPAIEVDPETRGILNNYEKKVALWKGSYLLSLFVVALALIVFFIISVYLGAKFD